MLKINDIHFKGEENELLSMEVTGNGNLKGRMLVDQTFNSGEPSNKLRHVFVFPDKEVKKGDFIRLYTGKGENRTETNNNGDTVHCFYWGFESSRGVWNKDGDKAFLLNYEVEDSQEICV